MLDIRLCDVVVDPFVFLYIVREVIAYYDITWFHTVAIYGAKILIVIVLDHCWTSSII